MLLNCSIVEDSWEPLGLKGYQTSHPKGNQPWIFNGSINAEAEAPILWSPNTKNCIIGKYPEAGKDRGQEEKGVTEDEIVGWHHQLNGCEFGRAPGDSEGQGSLGSCSPWGLKESDTTERLNSNNEKKTFLSLGLWQSGGSQPWRHVMPRENPLSSTLLVFRKAS